MITYLVVGFVIAGFSAVLTVVVLLLVFWWFVLSCYDVARRL